MPHVGNRGRSLRGVGRSPASWAQLGAGFRLHVVFESMRVLITNSRAHCVPLPEIPVTFEHQRASVTAEMTVAH